jgi:hypothetical protein
VYYRMILLLCVLVASCAPAPTLEPEEEEAPPEPIQLFNGRDLTGWRAFLVDPAVAMADVWSVEDGILICKGEPLGYLYTERSFTSFDLLVEWRWAPGTEPGNSGVLMRITGEPMGIPRSIESQLRSGNAGDLFGFHGMRIAGDPERSRSGEGHELLGDFRGVSKIEGAEKTPGEWNQMRIRLHGPDVTVHVNDVLVNEATECEVVAGPIGLQSEGGEIHFRRVEIVPVD